MRLAATRGSAFVLVMPLLIASCAADAPAREPSTSTSNAPLLGAVLDMLPHCDPLLTCCFSGGMRLDPNDACQGALIDLGCRNYDPSGAWTTYGQAVMTDGIGNWFWNVICPAQQPDGSSTALPVACVLPPNVAHLSVLDACVPAPPRGDVNITFDPNCAGGCRSNL
jgi:hypothetical protein